jgi:peptidyl-tRNA hydrolase
LKDIIAKLDTKDFWRLRIGVDRPAAESSQSVADYVLQNFPKTDLTAILDKWEMIENMVGDFLTQK